MDQIRLEKVSFIPKQLEDGILYVSHEFEVAAHLCACGCGNKVVTPIGPAEWTFNEKDGKPSLSPSIGNWQLPCRTHYVISYGRILWARNWSDAQVKAGRRVEEAKRQAYYASLYPTQGIWARIKSFVMGLIRK